MSRFGGIIGMSGPNAVKTKIMLNLESEDGGSSRIEEIEVSKAQEARGCLRGGDEEQWSSLGDGLLSGIGRGVVLVVKKVLVVISYRLQDCASVNKRRVRESRSIESVQPYTLRRPIEVIPKKTLPILNDLLPEENFFRAMEMATGLNPRRITDSGKGLTSSFRAGLELGNGNKYVILTNTTVEIRVPENVMESVYGMGRMVAI
ncbi:hypothetical protein V6N13_089689 [Hibiscus sabdariffa]